MLNYITRNTRNLKNFTFIVQYPGIYFVEYFAKDVNQIVQNEPLSTLKGISNH